MSVDVPPVRSSRDRVVGRNKRKADSAASRDDDVERQAKLEQALLQQLDMQKKLHEQLEVLPSLVTRLLCCFSSVAESPPVCAGVLIMAVRGYKQHRCMSPRLGCRPATTCVAGSEAAADAARAAPAAYHGHAQGADLGASSDDAIDVYLPHAPKPIGISVGEANLISLCSHDCVAPPLCPASPSLHLVACSRVAGWRSQSCRRPS